MSGIDHQGISQLISTGWEIYKQMFYHWWKKKYMYIDICISKSFVIDKKMSIYWIEIHKGG